MVLLSGCAVPSLDQGDRPASGPCGLSAETG